MGGEKGIGMPLATFNAEPQPYLSNIRRHAAAGQSHERLTRIQMLRLRATVEKARPPNRKICGDGTTHSIDVQGRTHKL